MSIAIVSSVRTMSGFFGCKLSWPCSEEVMMDMQDYRPSGCNPVYITLLFTLVF